MTINNDVRVAGPFPGTGVSQILPFTFRIFAASDVVVISTDPTGVDTTLTSGYSVFMNPDQSASPGGTVTLTQPSALYKTTLTTALPNTQPAQITNGGGFFPAVFNDVFDRLTVLIQQAVSAISLAVRFPVSDGANLITVLPTASARAGTVLAFDALGNVTVSANLGNAAASVAANLVLAQAAANQATAAVASQQVGMDSGTANAMVVANVSPVTGLVDRMRVRARKNVTSGGAITVSVDGLPAKPLQDNRQTAFTAQRTINAGTLVEMIYIAATDTYYTTNALGTAADYDAGTTNYRLMLANGDNQQSGNNVVSFANGLAASPSMNFNAEPTTGFYRTGAGQLAFTVLGVLKTIFNATGIGFGRAATYENDIYKAGTGVVTTSAASNDTVTTALRANASVSGQVGTLTNNPLELLTNGTAKASIDTTGRMNVPNQPSFSAYRDAGSLTTGQTPIIWNGVKHNVGSNYNAATGRFTAPVAGRYVFNVLTFHSASTTSNVNLQWRKNGTQVGTVYCNPCGVGGGCGGTIIDLAANDYVDIALNIATSGGYSMFATASMHNEFSGFLQS